MGEKQSGAVLLVVILLIGLLSIIALGFVVTMRSHVKLIANSTDRIHAESLANSGVSLALLKLTEPANTNLTANTNWAKDGVMYQCSTEVGGLTVWVEDEGGKVDLNSAGPVLFRSLVAGMGVELDSVDLLTAALLDFRDIDDDPRPNGAEEREYLAAGLNYSPKNARFETIDELAQVLNMSPSLYTKLKPFVTVHSRRAGIDQSVAPPALLEIIRSGADLQPDALFPNEFISPSTNSTFTIIAHARTISGSNFTRRAIVSLNGNGYVINEWRIGNRNAVVEEGLPQC